MSSNDDFVTRVNVRNSVQLSFNNEFSRPMWKVQLLIGRVSFPRCDPVPGRVDAKRLRWRARHALELEARHGYAWLQGCGLHCDGYAAG
jgi:hypothetical protein